MRGEIDWTLIAKYLGGDATSEEREFIESTARENKVFAEALDDVTEIWNLSISLGEKRNPEWSQEEIDKSVNKLNKALTEATSEESILAEKLEEEEISSEEDFIAMKEIWDASKKLSQKRKVEFSDEKIASVISRMKDQLVEEETTAESPSLEVTRNTPNEVMLEAKPFDKNKFVNYYRSVAAASIVFLVAFLGGYYVMFKGGENLQTFVAYEETSFLKLEDGSEVWLQKGSELKYPEEFSEEGRSLYLKGSAFFKVTKDKNRPFSVSAEGSKVEVLGTAFKFTDKPEKSVVEVISGKVAFSSNEEPEKKIVLVKSERGVLEEGLLNKHEGVSESATQYMLDKLVFEGEVLKDVVPVIEQAYGVSIQLDETLRNKKFTGTFKNEPLNTLLSQMSIAIGAKNYVDEETQEIIIEKE